MKTLQVQKNNLFKCEILFAESTKKNVCQNLCERYRRPINRYVEKIQDSKLQFLKARKFLVKEIPNENSTPCLKSNYSLLVQSNFSIVQIFHSTLLRGL